jgi:hypothetical protein
VKTATRIFIAAAVLGAAGGTAFLSSRPAGADFAGPFAGGSSGGTGTPRLDTGSPLCLDGSTCSVKVVYDGGTIGLVGAEVDAHSGFYDSQKVNPDLMITPHSVIAQAPTGDYAFRALHNGLWDFGDSTTDYCQSVNGEVQCAGQWQWGSIEVDTIGSATANRVIDIFNPHVFPVSSLGTCNGSSSAGSIPEGTLKVVSGSSLSAQSRVCACVSDGAGTPAYTWVNLGCPNTAGTNSTCPACP